MNEFQAYNFPRHYIPNNDEIKNDNEEEINFNYADINRKNNNNYYLNNNNKNREFENNNFDVKKKNNNDFSNNKDNIFGLNFHQDEGDENEVINSLHFIKFIQNKNGDNFNYKNDNYINNMITNSNKISYRNNNTSDNTNNYEQKVKNNRNLINNNLKNSLIMDDDEPFQISASKYTESNIANDNQSIFSNSRINKYYMNNENKNQNNIDINNNRLSRRENNNNVFDFSPKENNENSNENNYRSDNFRIQKIKKINNNQKNNKNRKESINEEQNKLKNDLLLKNNNYSQCANKANYHINNPYIIPNKRATSKKNISFSKNNNNNNNTINGNYYNQKNINYKTIQNNNNNYNTTEMNSSFYSNTNNTNQQNKIKKNNSYRVYNVNINNFQKFNSIDYTNNNNNNNTIIKEMNLKKIYSKRQKAELDMVRGCFLYDNKAFNFDIRNGLNTINYIKFIKPTEPIISINYKNVQKFYPLIRKQFTQEVPYTNNNSTLDINQNHIYNNNINSNNSHLGKYQSFIDKDNNIKASYNVYDHNENLIPNYKSFIIPNKNSNRNNNPIIDKINKNHIPNNYFKQIENTKRNIKFNNKNYNEEETNHSDKNSNNNNKIDKDGLSFSFKQRIYDWLVDIDIIKDKIIKIDSLPTICINGVLLCDLINRCEGKNEILKGIIRKTSTRSQIQVNINKVMEYLRTLEKFPSRHLWNNIEILKGNSLVIWQLLDDIYNFYGNKVTFKRMHRRMNSKKSLNRTFTIDRNNSKSRTIDKYDKKDDNFGLNNDSYKPKTPLKNSKKFKLNSHHNNNNCENSFYINDKEFSKFSYTPVIDNNRIKNKNKIKSEIDNNIKNYNESKNKFDINQNNINKINKKIKKTYEDNKKFQNMEDKNNLMNFDFKRTTESPNRNNRNNLNHTNDNINESKMFSIEDDNDYVNYKNKNNKARRNNDDKSFQRNIDISSIYSDKITNVDKINKSFSGNNRIYIKKNKNCKLGNSSRYNINSNNQSFYSTKPENRIRNKGCYLLFEKSSINKLREKMGAFHKYNTNDVDTLDFRDI